MSDKPVRDEQGQRLHLPREYNFMPDDIRQQFALDVREARVSFPHSAPGRRQYLADRFEAGAPWAEAFHNKCMIELEEKTDREWKVGEAAIRQEERDRAEADAGAIPSPRNGPDCVQVDDDTEDLTDQAAITWTPSQEMTLLTRYAQGRIKDIQMEKEAAVKRRDQEASGVKALTKAQNGQLGVIRLAQTLSAGFAEMPEGTHYDQVMRDKQLLYRDFGISARFFTAQLSEASAQDAVDSAQ